MGKLITIEGTDCSGKGTQSDALLKILKEKGYKAEKISFPMYDTPTGRIVGGPYLGKPEIGEGYFKEGASNVPPLVASPYFSIDRLYNIPKVNALLEQDYIVILDRYVESNMAHQGGKIKDPIERRKLYNKLHSLEYEVFELPRPDLTFFLYMPYQYSCLLKKNRKSLDQHETSEEHLRNAEEAYLELVDIYNYEIINCVENGQIRSIEDITGELYSKVDGFLKAKKRTINLEK